MSDASLPRVAYQFVWGTHVYLVGRTVVDSIQRVVIRNRETGEQVERTVVRQHTYSMHYEGATPYRVGSNDFMVEIPNQSTVELRPLSHYILHQRLEVFLVA